MGIATIGSHTVNTNTTHHKTNNNNAHGDNQPLIQSPPQQQQSHQHRQHDKHTRHRLQPQRAHECPNHNHNNTVHNNTIHQQRHPDREANHHNNNDTDNNTNNSSNHNNKNSTNHNNDNNNDNIDNNNLNNANTNANNNNTNHKDTSDDYSERGGRCGRVISQASSPHRVASFDVQTLWYRAPEVQFGDPNFDYKVDIWSLGTVLAEMTGETYHMVQAGDDTDARCATVYREALLEQFGMPEASCRVGWTLWGSDVAGGQRKLWPPSVRKLLGCMGELLLDALLDWDPKLRPTARSASDHTYFHPCRFGLGGCTASEDSFHRGFEPLRRIAPYAGIRHPWNLLTGTMGVETLAWLRLDLADTEPLDIDFKAHRNDVKSEAGRKFIMSGRMVTDPASQTMCTLSLAKLLPLPRLRAWFAAFQDANAEALGVLSRNARTAAANCEVEGQDKNRTHFMESPLASWFGSAAELCIAKADGSWQEPKHQDGGASVLHIGITLFGKRRMTCEQPEGEDVVLDNIPGTVYLGGLTGPTHAVKHLPSPADELLSKSMSVSVMLRTTLFKWTQSRVRGTTPHPVQFFHAISASFLESLAGASWCLPSLEACVQIFDREASGLSPVEASGRSQVEASGRSSGQLAAGSASGSSSVAVDQSTAKAKAKAKAGADTGKAHEKTQAGAPPPKRRKA